MSCLEISVVRDLTRSENSSFEEIDVGVFWLLVRMEERFEDMIGPEGTKRIDCFVR